MATIMAMLTVIHTSAVLAASSLPQPATMVVSTEAIKFRQQSSSAEVHYSAQLRPVNTVWHPLATLKVSTVIPHAVAAEADPVVAGDVALQISRDGLGVRDLATGQWAYTRAVTGNKVHPRDVLLGEGREEVWLYGDGVYRYRVNNRNLEYLQDSAATMGVVRKVLSNHTGLWVLAEKGLFLLKHDGSALSRVDQPQLASTKLINGVTTEDALWLATADQRLFQLSLKTSGQLDLLKRTALPAGTVAEMVAGGNRLWMLLGNPDGHDYRLAFIDESGGANLNMLEGRYYTLQKDGAALLARTYSTLFRIAPGALTITRINLDEQRLLAQTARNSMVSFVGSSYVYKDGCEIVERGRFDLSKGWRGTNMAVLDGMLR